MKEILGVLLTMVAVLVGSLAIYTWYNTGTIAFWDECRQFHTYCRERRIGGLDTMACAAGVFGSLTNPLNQAQCAYLMGEGGIDGISLHYVAKRAVKKEEDEEKQADNEWEQVNKDWPTRNVHWPKNVYARRGF